MKKGERDMKSYPSLGHVDQEIMNYLWTHPVKECTVTQMIKPGRLRKTSVYRKFLQKHLKLLEGRGLVYSTTVLDPVRHSPTTYYSPQPCSQKGDVGVPKFVLENSDLYVELITDFYANLLDRYTPLMKDYCTLCDAFQETLPKIKRSCGSFLDIFQSWFRESMAELEEDGIKPAEIEELRRRADRWDEQKLEPPAIFLEDFTIALIGYTVYYSYYPKCHDCKEAKMCQEEGRKWISTLLGDYLDAIPETDLTRFWKAVVSGVPEIKTALLHRYFASRFNLRQEHSPPSMLEIWDEAKLLPFFYSKVIPNSFTLLVENVIMPCMKQISGTYKRYLKKFQKSLLI